MKQKVDVSTLSGVGLGFVEGPAPSYKSTLEGEKLLFPNSPEKLVVSEDNLPDFCDVLAAVS